VEKIPSLINL